MKINSALADFSLPDLDGKIHSLHDSLGRIALINFWSAECAWAERVDAELIPLWNSWMGRVDLYALAANANEPDDLLKKTAQARALPFVMRATQEILDAFEAQITPYFLVVDALGVLRYRGAFDDRTFQKRSATQHYLNEAIEALFSGRMPDPAETLPYGCAVVRQTLNSC